jgi:hypothetical protein
VLKVMLLLRVVEGVVVLLVVAWCAPHGLHELLCLLGWHRPRGAVAARVLCWCAKAGVNVTAAPVVSKWAAVIVCYSMAGDGCVLKAFAVLHPAIARGLPVLVVKKSINMCAARTEELRGAQERLVVEHDKGPHRPQA